MQLFSIHTGFLKLDGGAMFGIVPRQLWQRLNPPDEQHRCTWAMRCLLIDTGERRVLIDTGIGDALDDHFRALFPPFGDETLLGSLQQQGYTPEMITDVLLTHLHFDHAGGCVRFDNNGRRAPAFPNAVYWTNRRHFDWAVRSNAREAASFRSEFFLPLQEAGVLRFLEVADDDFPWLPGIHLRFVYGHTEAMMLPIIDLGDGRLLYYCADLIPSSFHIGLPYIMAYDVRPLHTLQEKERLLHDAVQTESLLFFEHDPHTACASLRRDERGRIVLDRRMTLEEGLKGA